MFWQSQRRHHAVGSDDLFLYYLVHLWGTQQIIKWNLLLSSGRLWYYLQYFWPSLDHKVECVLFDSCVSHCLRCLQKKKRSFDSCGNFRWEKRMPSSLQQQCLFFYRPPIRGNILKRRNKFTQHQKTHRRELHLVNVCVA